MKQWFSGLGLKSKEEPIEDSLPEREASASLALKVLYDQLRLQRKYHILDLGLLWEPTLTSFPSFPARCTLKTFTGP